MSGKSLDKTLISLAFLRVNWDQKKLDYIDNFLPFLATLIIRRKYGPIEENAKQINKLTSDFKQEFGLLIPYHPMITILNRAKKRGLIEKQEHKFVPTDKVYKYDFSGKAQAQAREYEKLIISFIDFCNEKYDKSLNKEQAEKILIGFLKQHDLEILFAAYDSSVLPDVGASKIDLFLFNKFVENIYKREQGLFQILLDIVIGHILAAIVLYGDKFNNFVEPSFKNLNLYLDTGLILRLLGVEGEEIQSAYSKFLDELKDQGVNLFVFRHTYDEIMGILQNCRYWIDNPNYDPLKARPVLRCFKAQNYRESDVQMFINKVDNILDGHGIKQIGTPDPNIYRYQIDEEKLQSFIADAYRISDPSEFLEKEHIIQRDIQSISAVYKLREGKKPQNIRQAGHIFITTNSTLAYANTNFEKEEYGGGFYIPSSTTDIFIGTLIWLRNPQKVTEINERKVITDIYAALQPSKELLERYITELEKLKGNKTITEDDYLLLRDSQVATNLLTEETLGDPDKFTSRTPIEILDKMGREANERYLQEKKEHEETKAKLKSKEEEKGKLYQKWDKRADRIATYMAWAIPVIFFICSCLFYFGGMQLLVIIIFLVLGVLSIFGVHIKIKVIKVKIKRGILKFIGLSDEKHGV